jgi:hypothetical protein
VFGRPASLSGIARRERCRHWWRGRNPRAIRRAGC